MNNVMIDIETTGTAHHSAIVSYGAAVFEPLTGSIVQNFISVPTGMRTAKFVEEK